MRSSIILLGVVLFACASPKQIGPMDVVPPALASCRILEHQSLDEIRDLDIVLALDTSRSTVDPTGLDIDQDGVTGRLALRRAESKDPPRQAAARGPGQVYAEESSDRGDSYLGAQILAARALVHGLAGRGNRFAILAWAGEFSGLRASSDIRFTYDLTDDAEAVDVSLQEIYQAGGLGNSNLAAPIGHGVGLLTASPSPSYPRFLLLISDVPESSPPDTYPDWRSAVEAAKENSITINTFAIGAGAIKSPKDLHAIPEATGGVLHLVENPAELHCELASSLSRP